MRNWRYGLGMLLCLAFAVGCSSMVKPGGEDSSSSRQPASNGELRAGLEGWLSPAANAALWGKYCLGDYNNPGEIPRPNYENPFIANYVLPKFRQVGDKSFYLYGDVLEVYGLRDPATKRLKPVTGLPEGISATHNAFFVYLCGEFRDRATLVEEKLKWVAKIHKLPMTPQRSQIDVRVSPFAQLSAYKYTAYLKLSADIFTARQSRSQPQRLDFGGGNSIDPATEAFSVCDVRYMMTEYIAKDRQFDDINAYEGGLEGWQNRSAADGKPNCSQEDRDYVYDFRGDSNFKPNSPESNAMIWASNSIAKMCANPVQSKDSSGPVKDSDCRAYYTKPFESRWGRARQGLMTWLFYPDQHKQVFANTKSPVVVYPNSPSALGKDGPLPYSFSLESPDSMMGTVNKSDFNEKWVDLDLFRRPDMGFNHMYKGWKVKEILGEAVDRHTDWYQSAYDDQRGKKMKDSYSPFVASSYELSKSDAFIACGYTVPCQANSDPRRQWMFVFKIHRDNWYRTQDAHAGKAVNFSTMWFDETSFGQTQLADDENAFDRLGTAIEGEYEDIMYVHNLEGKVDEPTTDGLPGDDPYEANRIYLSRNTTPGPVTPPAPPVKPPVEPAPPVKPPPPPPAVQMATRLEITVPLPAKINPNTPIDELTDILENYYQKKLSQFSATAEIDPTITKVGKQHRLVIILTFPKKIVLEDFIETLKELKVPANAVKVLK